MEEEQAGVTLGDILRVIASQKWLALIIAAVIAIAGSLGLLFGYNAAKTQYTTTFNVNFAGSDSGKYPDNVAFDYRDIVSRDSVEDALSSSDEFKNIDENKLVRSLSITKIYEEVTNTLVETKYQVSVKASCFDSEEQASAFLSQIIEKPIRHVRDWAKSLSHDADLKNYDAAKNFDDKIKYLNLQVQYLDGSYNSLLSSQDLNIGKITDSYRSVSGKLDEIENEITFASSELIDNRYVIDMASLKNYAESYPTIKENLDNNKKIWDMMFGEKITPDSIVGDGFISSVYELARQITSDEKEIKVIAEYLEKNGFGSCVTRNHEQNIINITVPEGELSQKEGITNFGKRLDAVRNELQSISDEYGDMFVELHNEAAKITHEGAFLQTDGGMSAVVAIILSVVVGIIIGCIVALVKAMPAYLKKKRGLTTDGTTDGELPDGATPATDGDFANADVDVSTDKDANTD